MKEKRVSTCIWEPTEICPEIYEGLIKAVKSEGERETNTGKQTKTRPKKIQSGVNSQQ